MDNGEGARAGIARLAELVGTARSGPEIEPAQVLALVAESLEADAVFAGRMSGRLHADHVVDRRGLGLRPGDAVTLHDQHFGARLENSGDGESYAHYESLVLAGAGGPCWGLSVPLFASGGTLHGRLCALFPDSCCMPDDGWTLLRLAGHILMETQEITDLRRKVLHDPLTGLPNRLLLRDRLQHAIAAAQRDRRPLALMLLDLDDFKAVNDTLGHQAGDTLLCQVGQRLLRPLRESDTVARLGGDEFVIILPAVDGTGAIEVARRLLRALRRPLDVGGQTQGIWASIGIALYPDDGTSPADLLEQADGAMYRAKRHEGGYALATAPRQSSPASLHTPHGRRS